MSGENPSEKSKLSVEELQEKCKDLQDSVKALTGDWTLENAFTRLITPDTLAETKRKLGACNVELTNANLKLQSGVKNGSTEGALNRTSIVNTLDTALANAKRQDTGN